MSQVVEDHLSLTKFLRSCESPMEQKFFAGLFEYFPGYPCDWNGAHILSRNWCEPHCLGFDLRTYPQRELKVYARGIKNDKNFKNYRADFLLVLTRWNHETGQTDTIEEMVVEVDGHDYHERTKEQAKRDRSRDRSMTASGLTVFRFTGSELFNQMEESIAEIHVHLIGKVWQYVDAKGLKFY
ncbi:hypothetical protein NBRC116493_13770 [Aurantivibrio infirmus]